MVKQRASDIHDLWKKIHKLYDRFQELDPVVQAIIWSIFFSPLVAKINAIVPSAGEVVCPFLGIQPLPFDAFPVQQGLLAVLAVSSSCTGTILLYATGLVLSLPLDISEIPSRVIEYFIKDAETVADDADKDSKAAEADLGALYLNFAKDNQATLFDLILAANYVDIKDLLDLTCQTVADMIKGKSPEEIRKTFNIKKNFTAEEEAEIRRENQWALE